MEQLDMIIKYLDGDVTLEEKISFEKEFSSSSSLRDMVTLVKNVDSVLADEQLLKYISSIRKAQVAYNESEEESNLSEDNNSKTVTLYPRLKKYLSVAAVLLILVVSSVLYINLSSSKTDRLYNQYYAKYESSIITRSSTDEASDLITAIQLYENGNYQGAIVRLNDILKADNNNTSAHFFSGLSYMELKSYNNAIKNFNSVILLKDTAFLEHAEWYMALCLIKTSQISNAAKILDRVAASNSYYKIKAADLLKKLR